jgi:hypothetical protein
MESDFTTSIFSVILNSVRLVPLFKSLTSAVTCRAVTHSWISNHSASRKPLKIAGVVDGLIARFREFAKIRNCYLCGLVAEWYLIAGWYLVAEC